MAQQVIGHRLDGTEVLSKPRCRICDRVLTSPKSIAIGVGCTCRIAIGMDPTNRNRSFARRKKSRAKLMAQEIANSEQMRFPW